MLTESDFLIPHVINKKVRTSLLSDDDKTSPTLGSYYIIFRASKSKYSVVNTLTETPIDLANTESAWTCCPCLKPKQGLQNSSCPEQVTEVSSQAGKQLELGSTAAKSMLTARLAPAPLQGRLQPPPRAPSTATAGEEGVGTETLTAVLSHQFSNRPQLQKKKKSRVPLITWPMERQTGFNLPKGHNTNYFSPSKVRVDCASSMFPC